MNYKKIVKIILLILLILTLSYFFRCREYYTEKFYDYKIEQAKKSGNYIKAEKYYKKKLMQQVLYYLKTQQLTI